MRKTSFPKLMFVHENIHLTDFCNQNCPFCFASEEMTRSKKKEMTFENFKFVVKKLKQAGVVNIDFLGGEPTLNSHFPKILQYALKNFFMIQIFTNGIFSTKIKKTLLKGIPRLVIVFNIATPGFRFNKKIREQVLENIKEFMTKVNTVISIVSTFLNAQEAKDIINLIPQRILQETRFKLSLLSPTVGDKNLMNIKDFPKIGKNVCEIISYLEKLGPPKRVVFNSMYRPCMFSESDKEFLDKRGYSIIYKTKTCHSNLSYGTDCIHINSDLETFGCYPLSTINIFSLTPKTNFGKLKLKYAKIEEILKRKYVLPECKKCPYFGLNEQSCSGPCLGFRINAFNELTK